jgi:D-methionine transport system substrate-binding protein
MLSLYTKEPFTENSKPYYNVIAALAEDVDTEVFQTIVEYYQSEGTSKVIEESSKGSQFPVWDEAK